MTTTTDTIAWERFRGDVQATLRADAPEHIQRLGWRPAQVEAAQRTGLRRLLAHAVEHSPFHARRLAGVELDSVVPGDLSRLPVMTKADMMASLDDVFTDRRLTREKVEAALAATAAEPVPVLGDYVALASGGSSGQRGVFVFDREALSAFVLSLSRPIMARLDPFGGPPPGGLPIALIAAASAVHATALAPALSVGPDVPFRFTSVPVTMPLPGIVERLNDLQPPVLYGYASMLAVLAAEQRAGRLRVSPLAVTSTSETLFPEARAAITEAFGVPVIDTFGSTEGLVGSSAPGDDTLVFNTDLCVVELVDDDHRPVPPGEPSARILVTNLANLVQPLIRYEINDCFVAEPATPDHGLLRARVHGRADDVLRYGDVDVHPLVVRSVIVKAPEVLDYQVRQSTRGIDVDAVPAGAFDAAALAAHLAAALEAAGLAGAQVGVRAVEALARHRQTGKLRRFAPLTLED